MSLRIKIDTEVDTAAQIDEAHLLFVFRPANENPRNIAKRTRYLPIKSQRLMQWGKGVLKSAAHRGSICMSTDSVCPMSRGSTDPTVYPGQSSRAARADLRGLPPIPGHRKCEPEPARRPARRYDLPFHSKRGRPDHELRRFGPRENGRSRDPRGCSPFSEQPAARAPARSVSCNGAKFRQKRTRADRVVAGADQHKARRPRKRTDFTPLRTCGPCRQRKRQGRQS